MSLSQRKSFSVFPAIQFIIIIALTFVLSVNSFAQEATDDTTSVTSVIIAPPTNLLVEDFEYDDGEKLNLIWTPSIDDQPQVGKVTGYQVFRVTNDDVTTKIAELMPGANNFTDQELDKDSTYSYYVTAIANGAEASSVTTSPISPQREWVNFGLTNLFVIALIIGGAIFYFIEMGKRGKKLFVRKIAGLEAVDDAIGRATEMGRPILYIPGIHDMDDVQTLASLTILGRVAEQIADYDIKIRMPVARSLVMTAARETIKASYQAAGRPDAYSDDMVSYITDEQFGYVAAVDGIMVREKPATVFLLGAFFAESLILAETGNHVGAIQIAGTARPAQLPFFIAACDFTLIGEELFAASAYLSNEPKALGALKGQDVGKIIAAAAIIAGVLLETVIQLTDSESAATLLGYLRQAFTT